MKSYQWFILGLFILVFTLVFMLTEAEQRKDINQLQSQVNAVSTQSEQNASHFRGVEPTEKAGNTG